MRDGWPTPLRIQLNFFIRLSSDAYVPPFLARRRLVEDYGVRAEIPIDLLWDPHPFGGHIGNLRRPLRSAETIIGWLDGPPPLPRLQSARRDPGCMPPPQCQADALGMF